jgi:hypothetical protein
LCDGALSQLVGARASVGVWSLKERDVDAKKRSAQGAKLFDCDIG